MFEACSTVSLIVRLLEIARLVEGGSGSFRLLADWSISNLDGGLGGRPWVAPGRIVPNPSSSRELQLSVKGCVVLFWSLAGGGVLASVEFNSVCALDRFELLSAPCLGLAVLSLLLRLRRRDIALFSPGLRSMMIDKRTSVSSI